MATSKKASVNQEPIENETLVVDSGQMQEVETSTEDMDDREDLAENISADDMEGEEMSEDNGELSETLDEDEEQPEDVDGPADSEVLSALQTIDTSRLSAEEKKAWGALVEKISYRGHSVSRASKKKMRQMMSEGTHIHTRTGTLTVNTETKQLREDMVSLAASAREGRVLLGEISGVREIDTNGTVKQYLARVAFGNGTCQVLIPDFVLFNYDYNNRLDPETQKKVLMRMNSMVGTEIDFVVKHWDVKEKIAYGDRLKAMEKLGWNYFLNERNPERVGKGMLVEATVITVRPRYIVVSAMGVESRIPIDECGWEHYLDLRENFKNNQKVVVKVLDISEVDVKKASNEMYHLVGLQLSIKQTSKDPREKFWDIYNESNICMARVTSVDPNGNGIFVMLDGKVPALCAYPKYGEIPEVGEKRLVQITEKTIVEKQDDSKEYRIFCVLKNL